MITATLALSGTSSRGTPPMASKARVWAPIQSASAWVQRRLGIGEVRGAQHGDEDLRLPDLAGQPVDDHRHRVAGVIDEQLVAAHMGLPHRDRELAFPAPVQLAEALIAIPVRVCARCTRPTGSTSVTCLRFSSRWTLAQSGSALRRWPCFLPAFGVELRFQLAVGDRLGQRPSQPGDWKRADRRPHGRRRHAGPPRHSRLEIPAQTSTETLRAPGASQSSPLASIPPRPKPKERTLTGPAEAPTARYPGRHHPGMVGEIISERRATINRNGGRHHPGIGGRLPPESAAQPMAPAPTERPQTPRMLARAMAEEGAETLEE